MVQVWSGHSNFLRINRNPAYSVADHYSFQIFYLITSDPIKLKSPCCSGFEVLSANELQNLVNRDFLTQIVLMLWWNKHNIDVRFFFVIVIGHSPLPNRNTWQTECDEFSGFYIWNDLIVESFLKLYGTTCTSYLLTHLLFLCYSVIYRDLNFCMYVDYSYQCLAFCIVACTLRPTLCLFVCDKSFCSDYNSSKIDVQWNFTRVHFKGPSDFIL